MADQKISALTTLPQASWATNDLLAIVDTSATETKKTTINDLNTQISAVAVAQTITNGITASAPSQDAVYDALGTKLQSDFTTLTSLAYNAWQSGDIFPIYDISAGFVKQTLVSDLSSFIQLEGSAIFIPFTLVKTLNPNNLGLAETQIAQTYNIEPLQNSPNDSETFHNYIVNLDPTSTGFTFGTNGDAVSWYGLQTSHQGTGDIGNVRYFQTITNIGNGTDPISMNGIAHFQIQGHIDDNVTVTGQISVMGSQLNIDVGAVLNNQFLGFYDQNNILTAIAGYRPFTSSSNIAEIKNNSNIVYFGANGTVTKLTGNAGAFGFSFTPTIGAGGIGTGSVQGIYLNPNISNNVNYNGIYSSTSGVTGGTKYAGYFDGDVWIVGDSTVQGDLNVSGNIAGGNGINVNKAFNIVDGGGNPNSANLIVTGLNAGAGVTIANIDTFGLNTAMLINVGAGSTLTSGPFKAGLTAIGFPAVINLGAGTSVDYVSGATFALAAGTNGVGATVGQSSIGRFIAVPGANLTTTRLYGMHADLPFGSVGATQWGIYADEMWQENYLGGKLRVGGTAISDDTTASGNNFQVGGNAFIDGNAKISGGLVIKDGANKTAGKATLVAGTVTVSNTLITANSLIFLTPQETGNLIGTPRISARSVGTSFTITSTSLTDTAEIAWLIVEPY